VAGLRSRGRFGVTLGLDRIEALLADLGHPDRALRGALVAGTNGKGSVVAMTGSVLRAAGLKTGEMPKPHLVSYRERIVVDGQPLEPEAFAAALAPALAAADRVAPAAGPPTEFEVLTAAGFAELARQQVDEAVVEVGLGGRLDATNAADLGVAAITTIQHDHERHLGRTLAAIGGEKAAIIKPGNLVVSGVTGRGLAPILGRCQKFGVKLVQAGPGGAYQAVVREIDWTGTVVDLETPDGTLAGLRVGLIGRHQAHNAAVAVALLQALQTDADRRGLPFALDEQTVRTGLGTARWAGRLERMETDDGPVVFDGAHNPAGARVLVESLAALGVRGTPLVFGAMAGKRVSAVLRQLASLKPRPIFTAVADPHALAPDLLLRTWRRVTGLDRGDQAGRVASTPAEALALARSLRRGNEPVLVSGSLYLVGALRAILTGEEPDQ
jgi:dihydrofolate synthase/folylpolyglutamate synthase